MDIGQKIPGTITISIREQGFMLKVDMDIGILSSNIPTLTKVNMVDCRLFWEILLVVM